MLQKYKICFRGGASIEVVTEVKLIGREDFANADSDMFFAIDNVMFKPSEVIAIAKI